MTEININKILEKYTFLDKQILKEPHIFELLNEISLYQKRSLPDCDKPFATMVVLKKSRNIKIPYTSNRDKNIEYLIEILTRNYPDHIRPVVTFEFNVEKPSKMLNIIENVEYTIALANEEYGRLVSKKDNISLENLLSLLIQYRLFNLSTLVKKSKYKKDLTRVMKLQLGKQIFTFKNYSLDKNRVETAEDYCFHAKNYNSVRESIDIKKLKDIMSNYTEFIVRRLKKFGILSTEVNDYRDPKLDYIFNILLEDLSTTISDRDMIEIKNIHSLVKCVLKVDKILDPIQTIGNDIVKYIRENRICSGSDIIAANVEITEEILKKWEESENPENSRILSSNDKDGNPYFIDGTIFLTLISKLNQLIFHQPEKMAEMPYSEKKKAESQLDILYITAKDQLSSPEKIEKILNADKENIEELQKIVDDYENRKKRQTLQSDLEKQTTEIKKERGSIFQTILNFIKSLFSRKKKKIKSDIEKTRESTRPIFSKQTRQIYKKIVDKAVPLIPMSDMIELIPENDSIVDEIIDELREQNVKIVIPVFNARQVLYPKRSKKLLIPDAEYLLVSTHTTRSYESIREFTDSLFGYKIKDEIIPRSGIMVIEKYLLTLYHQKRAQALKKEL